MSSDCKPGYQFYVCSVSQFKGCCKIDPCSTGCPPDDIQPPGAGTLATTATISSTSTPTSATIFSTNTPTSASTFITSSVTTASGSTTRTASTRTTSTRTTPSSSNKDGSPSSAVSTTTFDTPASSTNDPGPLVVSETGTYYSSSSHTTTPTSSGIEAPTSPATSGNKVSINTGAVVGGVVGGAFLVISAAFLFFWLRKRKAASRSPGVNTDTSHSPRQRNWPPFIGAIMNRFSSNATPENARFQPQPFGQEIAELAGDSMYQIQPKPIVGVMAELPEQSPTPRPETYSLAGVPEAVEREQTQSGYISQFPTPPVRNSVSSLHGFPNPGTTRRFSIPRRPVSTAGNSRYSYSPVSPEISQGGYSPTSAGSSRETQPIQGDWDPRVKYRHSLASEPSRSSDTPSSAGPSQERQPVRRDPAV